MEDHVHWLLSVAAPARYLVGTRTNVSAFIEVALAANSSTVLGVDLVRFAKELNAQVGLVSRSGHVA